MESGLVWVGTLAVCAVIFAIYWRKFKRERELAEQRKQEARTLGIDKPRAQYPFIDASQCIGCGSCVSACPEGDVLAVVWGTATIVNGERCVGHARCEAVCPVGALKVGLGDLTTRPDIPILTEANETTVPGLFIAGELSGISLIRNAVAQGKLVIDAISERSSALTGDREHDVIIVGAGPAGITAALQAHEAGLRYLLIDQGELGGTIAHYPRRKLVMTQSLDLPLYGRLRKEEYSKEFLQDLWQELQRRFELNFQGGEKLEALRQEAGGFHLQTSQRVLSAHHVVLALGRRGTPRRLGITGEDLPKVMYQLIDAQSYSGRDLLVVGGGDSAVEAAVGLARQQNNRVTLSYRRSGFPRIKKKNQYRIMELINKGRIDTIFESNLKQVTPNEVLISTPTEERRLVNDYVFIFAGGIPPFDFLKEMGIKFGGEIQYEPERAEIVSLE